MNTPSIFQNISSVSSFKAALGLTSADLIAAGALITAFFSMVITVFQAWITRKHNRLSVRPHIGIRTTTSIKSPITIKIENNGVGPAIIYSIELRIDNFKYSFCGNSNANDLCNKIDESLTDCGDIKYATLNPPVALGAGHDQLLIEFTKSTQDQVVHDKILDFMKTMQIQTRYRSLYNKKYCTKKYLIS